MSIVRAPCPLSVLVYPHVQAQMSTRVTARRVHCPRAVFKFKAWQITAGHCVFEDTK